MSRPASGRYDDDAFVVTAGTVRKAKRKQLGSNQEWDIPVESDSVTDTVTMRRPTAPP